MMIMGLWDCGDFLCREPTKGGEKLGLKDIL